MEFTNIQPAKSLNGPSGYLGQKGYTLMKKDLTPEQQVDLKRELTAKPFTQGSVVSKVQHTFPVYRESDNKFTFLVILASLTLDHLLKIKYLPVTT